MNKSNNERPFNRIYQPDNTSVTKSDTPRVDADEEWAWSGTGEDFRCVHASFARELERELAATNKRLVESEERERLALRNNEALRKELARKEAEFAEASGHIEYLDRLHEQERAQVARLREALEPFAKHPDFHAPDSWPVTIIDRNEPTGEPTPGVLVADFRLAAKAIASLPEQSARDAEVLSGKNN